MGVSVVGKGMEGIVAGVVKLVVGSGMLTVLVRNVEGNTGVDVDVSEVAGRLVVGMMLV